MTRLTAGVTIWAVESWTEAQWAEIPEADRPADAKPVRGGWSRIVPCEDSSPDSYAVAEEPPPPADEAAPRTLAELAADFRRADREYTAAHTGLQEIGIEKDRREDQAAEACVRICDARRALATAIAVEAGLTFPLPPDRWFDRARPLASYQADGVTFHLIPNDDGADPANLGAMIEQSHLVMTGEPFAPRPDPAPLASFAATFIGQDIEIRVWSPVDWEKRPAEPREMTFVGSHGWVLQIVPRGENEAAMRRVDERLAAKGKRLTADGSGIERIPSEPDPDEVARAEAQAAADRDRVEWIRRAHVVRSARRWEKARNALARVDSEPHPSPLSESWDAYLDARRLVEREARQLEVILGRAIIHHVAGADPGDSPPEFDRDRIRPAAVRIGEHIFATVADPVPTAEADSEDGDPAPIVVKLEVDRVVSLD